MESTAAGAGAGAGAGKKRKAAGASEGGGTWKRNKAMVHMVSLFANKMKTEVVTASQLGDDDGALDLKKEEGDSLFKEGEMLKLREEFWEAERLWRDKLVPGALDRWLERKAAQVPTVEKKKKVVRVILPDGYTNYMITNPDIMRELSDEEMAKCPERFRQRYAITKVINAKNRAYQQALIDQYRAFGFAYDEKEVTYDDEEVAVVKN